MNPFRILLTHSFRSVSYKRGTSICYSCFYSSLYDNMEMYLISVFLLKKYMGLIWMRFCWICLVENIIYSLYISICGFSFALLNIPSISFLFYYLLSIFSAIRLWLFLMPVKNGWKGKGCKGESLSNIEFLFLASKSFWDI